MLDEVAKVISVPLQASTLNQIQINSVVLFFIIEEKIQTFLENRQNLAARRLVVVLNVKKHVNIFRLGVLGGVVCGNSKSKKNINIFSLGVLGGGVGVYVCKSNSTLKKNYS